MRQERTNTVNLKRLIDRLFVATAARGPSLLLSLIVITLVALARTTRTLAQTSGTSSTGDSPGLDPGSLGDLLSQNPVIAYIGIVGLAIPFVLAIITRQSWQKDVKLAIWFVACVLLGAGYWAVDHWQSTEAVVTIMAILGISGLLYRMNNNAFDDLQAKRGLT